MVDYPSIIKHPSLDQWVSIGADGIIFIRSGKVDIGQRIGADVYFLYIPYAEEVYIPLLDDATDLNVCANDRLQDYKSGRLDFRKFYDQYEVALGSNSNLLIDSTPYLHKFATQGEQHNWSFDPHPNPLGFKRLGEFIAQSIDK